MVHRAASTGRRFSLTNQAKALAVILREEFGAAFVCYDAATAAPVGSPDTSEANGSPPALEGGMVTELASKGRAYVAPLAEGHYRLAIPLYESGQAALLAVAALPALAPAGPLAVEEQERLQRWGQAVCDR